MKMRELQMANNNGMDPRWFNGGFKGFNTALNSFSEFRPSDFDAVKNRKANTMRVFIKIEKNAEGRYHVPQAERDFHEYFIAQCARVGLFVMPVLQVNPAGSLSEFWADPICKQDVGAIIIDFASRYWRADHIIGIDLLNEPVIKQSIHVQVNTLSYDVWESWMVNWAYCLRSVLPSKTVIVEPPEWAFIESSSRVNFTDHASGLVNTRLLPIPNVVYSFHYYDHHQLTHQNLGNNARKVDYPMVGQITSIDVEFGGFNWTSAPVVNLPAPPVGGRQATATAMVSGGAITGIQIEDAGKGYINAPVPSLSGGGGTGAVLRSVVGNFTSGHIVRDIGRIANWAKAKGVPLLLGEFSCVFYTDTIQRTAWTNDVMSACKMFGINWIYHSYREWDGWNSDVEMVGGVIRPIAGNILTNKIDSYLA